METFACLEPVLTNKPSLMRYKIITHVIANFENEDSDKISVTNLCRNLEISRTTFYENFNCKNELLMQIINYFWEDIVKNTSEMPYDEAMAFTMQYIYKRRIVLKKMLKKSFPAADMNRVMKFLAYTAEREFRMQEKRGRKLNFDVELVSVCYAGMFMNLISYWMSNDFRFSCDQVTKCANLMFGGKVALLDPQYR